MFKSLDLVATLTFISEPSVASSDATNMECTITRLRSEIVINGTKWWSSGKEHDFIIVSHSTRFALMYEWFCF